MSNGNALLKTLYNALFGNWQPGNAITLASPDVPASITGLFGTLLGTSKPNQGSLAISISAKPAEPGNSLNIVGTTTSALGGTDCKANAVFTQTSGLNPSLILTLSLVPTVGISLQDLLTTINLLPKTLTGNATFPSMNLVGLNFSFNSASASLSVTSEPESNPLIKEFPALKEILPKDLTLSLDIHLDPATSLPYYQVALLGAFSIVTVQYQASILVPLGLFNAWTIRIQPVGGSGSMTWTSLAGVLPADFGNSGLAEIPFWDDFAVSALGLSFFLGKAPFVSAFQLGVALSNTGLVTLNAELVKYSLEITGIALSYSAQRNASGSSYNQFCQLTGSAFFGDSATGFPASVNGSLLPLPGTFTISATSITVAGIWSILENAFNLSQGDLPPGLSSLDKLEMTAIQIGLQLNKSDPYFSLEWVSFTLVYGDALRPPWFDEVYLQAGTSMGLSLQKDAEGKLALAWVEVKGTLVFGQVEVEACLLRQGTAGGWSLRITSDKITIPGISDLSSFAGAGTLEDLLPGGIRDTGNFTLSQLDIDLHAQDPYLKNLSFMLSYAKTSPPWVFIPHYLEVTSFQLYANLAPLPTGGEAFSGYVDGVLTIAGVGLLLSANKASHSDPWVFKGNTLDQITVDLQAVTAHFGLPEAILDLLPTGLTVNNLDVTLVPSTGAFSTDAAITLTQPWPFNNLSLKTITFSIMRTKQDLEAQITGSLALGSGTNPPLMNLKAKYDSTVGWSFSGTLSGTPPTIKYLLRTYIDADLPVPDLTINRLAFNGNLGTEAFSFTLGCDWTINLAELDLGNLPASATANLAYNKKNAPVYKGSTVEGSLNFHGIILTAGMTFDTPNNNYFFSFLGVNGVIGGDSVTFTLKNESLGKMVSMLIVAATGENQSLPDPWSALNSVSLNDFSLVFAAPSSTDHTVTLSVDLDLNLDFADIQSVNLIYNCTSKQVKVNLTGTFLGQSLSPKCKNWTVNDPGSAPTVPGKGPNLFQLNLLGMGQHVALPAGTSTMQQAIAALRKTFQSPGAPSGVTYSQDAGWLIATQFTILDMFELAVLFNDPKLYGLLLTVSGGKFKGLEFEILYKQINPAVGVFYIEFSLPDYLRQMQFGAVSITLPDLGLWIYTNGGFKIDLGFPYNDDFSQSGGVQVLPFMGAGGFYFGVLHGQASSHLPQITASAGGNFNPVIVFGLGLQVGLGKSINKGPISAEIKIAVEGILEGILAPFHPYESFNPALPESETLFYYLQAQAGITGRVTGSLNLAIITASLNLVLKVVVTAVVEAHRAIELSLVASATIEVTISIDCGFFTIHIHLYFDFEVSDHFTLGDNSLGPWDAGFKSLRPPPRTLAMFEAAPLAMNWQAPAPVLQKRTMTPWFVPKFTLAGESEKEVMAAVLLVIDAPNMVDPAAETSFTNLAEALLLWTFNGVLNPNTPLDNIMDQEITHAQIHALQAYLENHENGVPSPTITPEDLPFFFENYLNIDLYSASAQAMPANDTFSLFPMLPFLELQTPSGKVDFSTPTCSDRYFQQIRTVFEDWA